MPTTVNKNNYNKPAPKWFRKLKKAIGVLTIAANVMVQSWGLSDALLVAHIQLWCTLGIGAILEALEIVLANGEEYVNYDNDYKKFYKNKTFLFILMCSLLFSCSPAKHTSKQVNAIETLQRQLDQKNEAILAKGIADYVKNNPCIYPEFDLDSLCDYYTKASHSCTSGYLMPNGKSRYIYSEKTKNILMPVPDNRLVNLLKDSLQSARNKLLQCESKEAGKKEAVQDIIKITDKPSPWRFNYWALLCITLAALVAIFLIRKYKR